MTKIHMNNDDISTSSVNLKAGFQSIGRADDNDLLIPDRTVSSYHARIFTYLEAAYIEDLGSTNGTYLNGKRVQKHTLRAGDIIRLGKCELKVA